MTQGETTGKNSKSIEMVNIEVNTKNLFISTAFLGHSSWQQKHLIQLSKSILGNPHSIDITPGGHTLLHFPHFTHFL